MTEIKHSLKGVVAQGRKYRNLRGNWMLNQHSGLQAYHRARSDESLAAAHLAQDLYFNQGKSINEIAKVLGRSRTMTRNYIFEYEREKK
ncbi:hypothetical protein VST7929_01329 [Vibrio stylophorae]|uniref:Uncharacterized protein n=1 Tax=Vibrio stylophorae TaxID=659351 RepID=A0ABM8ZT14_9VIBR|nr:hypothetical protein [Vibrio stylophorae]CAH0533461.1 hypothetical protein VST7929_01329 [Vibrio stylophorae]